MKLKSPHKDWKIDFLAVTDARAIVVDQLLTQLWLRVSYDNAPTATKREAYKEVSQLVRKIESPRQTPDFVGFTQGGGVAEAWLRADLLRVLKRSKAEFTVARPLHLPATRLRNATKAGDSGASGIVYAWLALEGPDLLEQLKEWLNVNVEDGRSETHEDLPSYALALLAADEADDVPKDQAPPTLRPTCRRQGVLYVADLRRLMAYRGHLPRPVLVDHVGRLTMLHLGLYLLRTYRAVSEVERTGSLGCSEQCASGPCPHDLELVVDCGEDARSSVARLAQSSWLRQEDIVARYVRAHLTLKKLSELEEGLGRRPLPKETLEDLFQIRVKASKTRLDDKARDRIQSFLSDSGDERAELEQTKQQYEELGLSDFDVYMALLFQASERRWFSYLRWLLDSMFLKNEADGLLRQPLGGRRIRRLALSPGMLETIALVHLIQDTEGGLKSRPLRLDQLVDSMKDRYGLLVATPPTDLRGDPAAVSAMLENHRMFRTRLRESGLFVDLSDAFLGQVLKPRVQVGA